MFAPTTLRFHNVASSLLLVHGMAPCQVLHGCSNDVLWLQRDFHLFLVNVFDTERAAAVGGWVQEMLTYLLVSYKC
jgi:ribonuclease D